jgi:hypothetical protein
MYKFSNISNGLKIPQNLWNKKDLSVLPMEKCLRTKFDQTFCINRDLKIKTNDGIYIEIYIVDSCKNLIEFEKINDDISELQLRFGN